MSELPKVGDRVIVHQNQKDCYGHDTIERNREWGYGNTVRNLDKYKRTGMIAKVFAVNDDRIYRVEIILDEKGKKPVTCQSGDRNRIDGRLELWANEFSLLEAKNE